MLLSALLLVAAMGPTPSPSPAPVAYPALKEIGHVKTSGACTTLRKLMLPIGFVSKKNEQGFDAIDRSMQKFLSSISPTEVPTEAELQKAIADQARAGGDARTASGMETGAQANESMGTEPQDDSLLYSGQGILTAANIDDVVQQIFQNLVLEDKIMNQSWKDYPQGSDPKVDALRQRAQNLIDLQRALAAQYESFAGSYLDNQGMAQLQSAAQRPAFKAFLRALLLGQAEELAAAQKGDPSARAMNEVSDFKRYADTASLVRQLRAQEYAFAPEVITTFNACHDTDVRYQAPQPAPTSTP